MGALVAAEAAEAALLSEAIDRSLFLNSPPAFSAARFVPFIANAGLS